MSASPEKIAVSPEEFYSAVSTKATTIWSSKESLEEKQEKLEELEREMKEFNEKATLNATQEAQKRAAEAKLEERKKQVELMLQAEKEARDAAIAKEALASSVTVVNESKSEPKPMPASEEDEINIAENKENEENKEKKSKDTTLEETKDKDGNKILNRRDAEGNVVSSAHFVKNENGGMTVHINASTEEGRLQSMKDGLKAMSEQTPNCSVDFRNFSDKNTYEGMKEAMNLNMAPHITDKGLMEAAEFFSEQAEKENPGTSREATQKYLEKVAGHDKLKDRLIEEMVAKGLGKKEELEKLKPEELAEKAVDQVMLDVEAKKNGPALVSSDGAQSEPTPAPKKEDEVKTESKNEPAKVEPPKAAASSTPAGPPSPSPLGKAAAEAVGEEAKEDATAASSSSALNDSSSLPQYK